MDLPQHLFGTRKKIEPLSLVLTTEVTPSDQRSAGAISLYARVYLWSASDPELAPGLLTLHPDQEADL